MNKSNANTIMFLFFLVVTLATGVVFYSRFRIDADLPEYVGEDLDKNDLEVIKSRNSSLISYAHLVPSATFSRESTIKNIVIHHTAGPMTLKDLGRVFSDRDRKVSANYGIDVDGNIGCYVEEQYRPWSSADDIDDSAITIEVSNDDIGGDWHVSARSFEALIDLCTDICKRNDIQKLNYTGDASGNLLCHNMFADTKCPGPYLESRMGDIAHSINKRLNK